MQDFKKPADLAERSRPAGGDKSAGGPPPRRFSAKRKLRAVSRLMRGEPLELVARELNVTAAPPAVILARRAPQPGVFRSTTRAMDRAISPDRRDMQP